MYTVHLTRAMFAEKPHTLINTEAFQVTTFVFTSGVLALKIANSRGEIVVLPYQGQQIWSATFDDKALGMKSMFDEPHPTTNYLHTYGGFFIHCGATRMGVPGPNDNHPLHGELPNAAYQHAWLRIGQDEHGEYIAVSGQFRYTVAFSDNYVAQPEIRLYAQQSVVHVSLTIENLKHTPMELMYLAHINFRPVDHATLHTTAPVTPAKIRVRRSIPSHISPAPGYVDFIESLADHPEQATTLTPGLGFDPEVVFTIDASADARGWAHSLQCSPDHTAWYVGHRPDQLPFLIRWISRTPDQDCLGFAMPATAEPEGYSAEKAKGNIHILAGQSTWRCDMVLGLLTAHDTDAMQAHIHAHQH